MHKQRRSQHTKHSDSEGTPQETTIAKAHNTRNSDSESTQQETAMLILEFQESAPFFADFAFGGFHVKLSFDVENANPHGFWFLWILDLIFLRILDKAKSFDFAAD